MAGFLIDRNISNGENMNTSDKDIYARFLIKPWQALTEEPVSNEASPVDDSASQPAGTVVTGSMPVPQQWQHLDAKSLVLLWDIVCYPFSWIRVRIKRLGLSGRVLQQAKRELTIKGLVIESSAGQTVYLIPMPETFAAFDMPCPYERVVSVEHSFYVALHVFLLKKDPRYKTVTPESPISKTGQTADLGILCHDGTKEAVEITLNTSNIISNAKKYAETSFARVLFLCRTYGLKLSAKASFDQSSLSTELLSRLDFAQFSTILHRHRKNYAY